MIHGLDDIGAGLLEHDQQHCALAVVPSRDVDIFRSLDRLAHVLDPDRGPIAIGDDHVVIVRCLGELIVGGDGEAAIGAVERALGGVGGGSADHAANVLQRQALARELGGVDLHPDGGFLLAADRHLRDAGNLGYLLRQNRIGEVIDNREGQGIGMYPQNQNR